VKSLLRHLPPLRLVFRLWTVPGTLTALFLVRYFDLVGVVCHGLVCR
jgi:hypothetical protein